MLYDDVPPKPQAPDAYNQKRWDHTALRRRMVTGIFEEDLVYELRRHFPEDRLAILGPPDLSSNCLLQISQQLAQLYHQEPTVSHGETDISSLVGRNGYVSKAGFFQLMSRVQMMTIALRECFVRIDVAPDRPDEMVRSPSLLYRLVTPDFVICEASPDAPDTPLYYQELRLRVDPETNRPVWIADVLDIRDEDNPTFALYTVAPTGELQNDVTEIYLKEPALTGERYPYRSSEGRPFLPVQLYHAEITGALFDAFSQSQITYGSLTASCLYSFYVKCVKDNSWPQKYIAGLYPSGMTQLDGDINARRASITTDLSSILVFQADPDSASQPLVGTFEYSDPDRLLESISKYEMRVATSAGISADILRNDADPRSGYALSISREGQRQSAAKAAPIFRRFDAQALAKSAMLANRYLGANLPESGYRVQYQPIKLSAEELKNQTEDITKKLAAGLISPVDALMILNPDLDAQEAKLELDRIRRERAEYQI